MAAALVRKICFQKQAFGGTAQGQTVLLTTAGVGFSINARREKAT